MGTFLLSNCGRPHVLFNLVLPMFLQKGRCHHSSAHGMISDLSRTQILSRAHSRAHVWEMPWLAKSSLTAAFEMLNLRVACLPSCGKCWGPLLQKDAGKQKLRVYFFPLLSMQYFSMESASAWVLTSRKRWPGTNAGLFSTTALWQHGQRNQFL